MGSLFTILASESPNMNLKFCQPHVDIPPQIPIVVRPATVPATSQGRLTLCGKLEIAHVEH